MTNSTNATRPTRALDDANAYFAARGRADAWFDATEAERRGALEQASMLLGAAFRFRDDARELNAVGELVWREEILAALCEEALWLLRCDPTQPSKLAALGATSVKIGELAAQFDRADAARVICEAAKILVGERGELVANDSPIDSFASTPLAL